MAGSFDYCLCLLLEIRAVRALSKTNLHADAAGVIPYFMISRTMCLMRHNWLLRYLVYMDQVI